MEYSSFHPKQVYRRPMRDAMARSHRDVE